MLGGGGVSESPLFYFGEVMIIFKAMHLLTTKTFIISYLPANQVGSDKMNHFTVSHLPVLHSLLTMPLFPTWEDFQ